jgi:hypothetical protein
MEWNLIGRFWRSGMLAGANPKGQPSQEPQSVSEWEASLIERGVASEWAPPIAGKLASAYKTLGRGSAAGLLLGVTLTVEAQAGEKAGEKAGVERGMRDVREVERLLGAFSGELEKLDEVLEVLSAYAQRMRNKPHRPAGQTLH